jgi:hypothetical protein
MQTSRWAAAVLAACALSACSRPPESKPVRAAAGGVKILNFYATAPRLPRGEKELLCYGVENAKTVWLEPPRQELWAALSRCVEVEPEATTTYTLTAQDASGQQAAQTVTVTIGSAKAKILEVRVSSLEVKKGQDVSLCWKTENAKKIKLEPFLPHLAGVPNCIVDRPQETRTYTLTVMGADGDQDQEKVTVRVR